MFVLGLQGSPRKKGNTAYLLSRFLNEAEKYGAKTMCLDVAYQDIRPCKELILCEKKGTCPIADDMQKKVYTLIRAADLVVLSSPVFFYHVTAQLKALIDRCQVFWARKYKLKLTDPYAGQRKGFLLSVAATSGNNLFEGVQLTARYFFDAISAKDSGMLTYRKIEHMGDMKAHETVEKDIQSAVKNVMTPFLNQKKILFVSNKDQCRTQMAAALYPSMGSGKQKVLSCGLAPAEKLSDAVGPIMAEKGIDMAFKRPTPLSEVLYGSKFETIFCLDEGLEEKLKRYGKKVISLKVNPPSGNDRDEIRRVRDLLEKEIASRWL